MSKWKETKLADICNDISYGYTESASIEEIGPKFLRITDIANGRLIWDKVPYCPITDSNFNKYRLYPGDIIIARTGATTGANYTIKPNDPTNVVFASYLIRYKINEKVAYPYFIGQLLQSNIWNEYVDAIAGGSAQPGANAKELGSFDISLPPLPEQKAIAEVLSSLDDKIDLLHRQNETLEKMAETLFRKWFVEDADDSGEEVSVSKYAEHSKISIKPNAKPITLFAHFSIPGYDTGKEPVYELGQEIKSNKYKVYQNSILFSKLNPHKVKRVWLILDEIPDNAICSTEFQVLKPHNENEIYFVYGWLTNSINYREISSGVGGTSGSHQRISPNEIFSFPAPKVSKEILIRYAENVKPIFQKQVNNQNQIRTLEKLRDTLLPKLISGEVRVEGV